MANQVQIANDALITLGANRISSFGEDTNESNAIDAVWDISREFLLAAHNWNFAMKRITLSPTVGDPDWRYKASYNLPGDFIKLVLVEDEIDYKVEQKQLLIDQESVVKIKYIFNETETANWPSYFTDLMSARLVSKLAYTITKSNSVEERAFAKFELALKRARYIDSTEHPVDRMGRGASPFISSRG